jgi:ubiquitin carboxyl-terminal hydrolase 22/27/51
MNVILQSFVHNPLLRGFFLSDRHNRTFCELSKQKKHCLPCEMDMLFDSMFSGEFIPFSPHHFVRPSFVPHSLLR